MIVDHSGMKLGKLAKRHDPRTLKLSNYVSKAGIVIPTQPLTEDWMSKVQEWGMMVNDQVGDCAVAGPGHIILRDTTYQGAPFRPSDAQIIKAYSDISGYNPSTGDNDNGCVILDVLNYWRKIGIGGHQIKAFVEVDHTNLSEMRLATYLFGSVLCGAQLPLIAQNQEVWDVPAGQDDSGDWAVGSWGGHCIPMPFYLANGWDCITWAQPKGLTDPWWLRYGDEAYAVISPDWAPPSGVAPNSFNMAQLEADLAAFSPAIHIRS